VGLLVACRNSSSSSSNSSDRSGSSSSSTSQHWSQIHWLHGDHLKPGC
jgi:hypothetical protein